MAIGQITKVFNSNTKSQLSVIFSRIFKWNVIKNQSSTLHLKHDMSDPFVWWKCQTQSWPVASNVQPTILHEVQTGVHCTQCTLMQAKCWPTPTTQQYYWHWSSKYYKNYKSCLSCFFVSSVSRLSLVSCVSPTSFAWISCSSRVSYNSHILLFYLSLKSLLPVSPASSWLNCFSCLICLNCLNCLSPISPVYSLALLFFLFYPVCPGSTIPPIPLVYISCPSWNLVTFMKLSESKI